MRKIHKVTLVNKTDKTKLVSIPDSYGYAVLKPGRTTIGIPYDDSWGLSGDQKVDTLVQESKDIEEIKKKFKGKIIAGDQTILEEDITEDGEWNPKPSKEGFTLEGLYSDKDLLKRVELPVKDIQGDITLYARFVLQIFTCEVKDGADDRVLVSELVNYGSSWNPNVSKEGHDLEGLYKEKTFKTKVTTPISKVTEQLTLYAKFIPTSEGQEGKSVSYSKEQLEAMDETQLKTLAKELGVEGYNRYTRKDSLISAILSK